jgi:hypothetical protein
MTLQITLLDELMLLPLAIMFGALTISSLWGSDYSWNPKKLLISEEGIVKKETK